MTGLIAGLRIREDFLEEKAAEQGLAGLVRVHETGVR